MTAKKVYYRGFNNIEFAEQFFNGHIFFNSLKGYINTADVLRRDRTEGEAAFKDFKNGVPITVRPFTLSEENFVCCLSSRIEGAKKFGKYVIKITDLDSLFDSLEKGMSSNIILAQNPPSLDFSDIKYSDGNEINSGLGEENSIKCWNQKPLNYSNEYEARFRFRFGVGKTLGEYESFTIEIPQKVGLLQKLYT